MQKTYIRVSGSATNYNYEGQLYQKGLVYGVPSGRAEILVRKRDNYGTPFFSLLSPSEVREITGEPEPETVTRPEVVAAAPRRGRPPKEKPPVVEVPETKREVDLGEAALIQQAEDEALDRESAITDSSITVLGLPTKASVQGNVVEV